MSKQPSGSRILLTRKSVASKTDFPKMETSASTPNESVAGILAKKTMIPEMTATFLREYFLFAVNAEIIISNWLKDEVNVANRNNSKNKLKKTGHNPIRLNTVGSTTNNNTGPSVASSPKANTTGKIASQASTETK